MKRLTLVILAVLLMLGISMNGAAFPLPTRCVVLLHVPFSFQVAGRAFPAGYYRFEQVLGNSDGVEVLVVRSLDGNFYQAVATKAKKMDETRPTSKIVFRHSGEKLVLAELCSQSKHVVLELYDATTKQPMLVAERDEDVVLPVPSDGELLAMARPAR
jgi:hypothetical protein